MTGKSIYILIMFLISHTAVSQSIVKPKKDNGIASSYSIVNIGRIANHSIQLNYLKKIGKWQGEIGMVIDVKRDWRGTNSGVLGLTGMNIALQYFPNNHNDRINSYLLSQLFMQVYNSQWTSTIWNDRLHQYEQVNSSNSELLLNEFLGYGISLDITGNGKIFFRHNVGLGVYYSHLKSSDSFNSDVEYDFRTYGNVGLDWYTKFQVVYII